MTWQDAVAIAAVVVIVLLWGHATGRDDDD